MLTSIKQKLTFMYMVLIIIPLLIISYWSIINMEESIFWEVEVNTLKTANVIAGVSRNHIDNIVELRRIGKQYVPPMGGRIIIFNHEKRVMADSFNLLQDQVLDNEEVRGALNNQEKTGYYRTDKYILQVAVPIVQTLENQRQVVGGVLISVNVDNLFQTMKEFRRQIIVMSSVAALIGLIVAVVASGRIATPIVLLSHAAKRIGEGNLGETVKITSKDEIGKLAENFNLMSKELYRIDQGRMQFIGDVSHELKTPLASMKALIDSLIYGENDIEIYREYLKDMDSEIDRLSNLVKSLLVLVNMEEHSTLPSAVPLQKITEDAVKIVKPLIEKSGVKMLMDFENPPIVLCYPDKIKEVMINLIDNAIHYQDPNKEEKQIWIMGKRKKEGYQLMVKDNGIGIDEKDLDWIFEKFYRADFSRSRDTGGAGIGLSIVNQIIKLHQWSIEVKSKLGEGTTFIIMIPKKSLKISS